MAPLRQRPPSSATGVQIKVTSLSRKAGISNISGESALAHSRPGGPGQAYFQPKTWMKAGVMMTTNSTGRKNRIIGTVSFGGSAAAFFSAAFMR